MDENIKAIIDDLSTRYEMRRLNNIDYEIKRLEDQLIEMRKERVEAVEQVKAVEYVRDLLNSHVNSGLYKALYTGEEDGEKEDA